MLESKRDQRSTTVEYTVCREKSPWVLHCQSGLLANVNSNELHEAYNLLKNKAQEEGELTERLYISGK
jgi:hypothetical protein